MPPLKSSTWQYFEKISNSEAKCRLCLKLIKTSGNTSNLQSHIKKVHKTCDIQTTQDPPVQKTTGKACQEKTAKRPRLSESGMNIPSCTTDDNSKENTVPQSPQKSSSASQETIKDCFNSITSFKDGGARYAKMNEAILFMICKDMQPLSIVEDEGFKELLKIAAPHYKIPSRRTIGRMLDSRYEIASNGFRIKLDRIEHLTLTTDVWSDMHQTRSFLGLTVHFIDGNKLQSGTLGVYDLGERHTGEYLALKIREICESWSITPQKVLAVVTDSGANMVKAIELSYGKLVHIPCFAHTLNLIVERAISSVQNLNELLNKIKSTVTWFKHSVVAADELRNSGCDLKLIQSVPTRWNSKYSMIERYLELRVKVNSVLSQHTSAPEIINAREAQELHDIMNVLQPFEAATRELCGENYVTCSKIIPMIHCLTEKVKKLVVSSSIAVELQESLITQILTRCGQVEQVSLLALSTLLDPRFKKIHFKDPIACSRAVKKLNDLVKITGEQVVLSDSDSSSSGGEQFSLWSDHRKLVNDSLRSRKDTGESEVTQYLRSPLGRLGDSPLLMWEEMTLAYPNLAKLAPKYLSIVATSVPSERLFSKSGQVLSDRRSRLTGENVSKLLFLQSLDRSAWF